jgi:tetratricopeptide (TPR) repeat protein
MALVCNVCGEANDDQARFCNQCAGPLTPDATVERTATPAVPAVQAPRSSRVNWLALALVVVLVGVIGWLLFAPKSAKNRADDMAAAMPGANPHAEGAMGAHAGMDPAVQKQIEDAKAALDKDPLATDQLSALYQVYALVNMQDKLRPMVDRAMKALADGKKELGAQATDKAVALAQAALDGNDPETATKVLTGFLSLEPGNLKVTALLGDLYYNQDQAADAVRYYTDYLKKAMPESEGDRYWNVRVDRATMYMKLAKVGGDQAKLPLAISELEETTKRLPTFWNAWFNLGQAYSQAGAKPKAEAAWQHALDTASGEIQTWRAKAALAELRGEPAPPPPANPHAGMNMPGSTQGS